MLKRIKEMNKLEASLTAISGLLTLLLIPVLILGILDIMSDKIFMLLAGIISIINGYNISRNNKLAGIVILVCGILLLLMLIISISWGYKI